MNKRGASMFFFSIATFLFVVRNVVHSMEAVFLAASLNSGVTNETYKIYYDIATTPYSYIFEIIALIVGIIYLVLAELEARK